MPAYRRGYEWWETIALMRRVVILCGLALLRPFGALAQITMALLVLQFFFMAAVYAQPFLIREQDLFESTCHIATSCVLAAISLTAMGETISTWHNGPSAVYSVFTCLTIIVSLTAVLRSMWRAVRSFEPVVAQRHIAQARMHDAQLVFPRRASSSVRDLEPVGGAFKRMAG